MDIISIDMHRAVPCGCKNPNTKVVYVNLEEKIKEAIVRCEGKLPLTITCGADGNIVNRLTVKQDDIIGYVTDITDDKAHVELNVYGAALELAGALLDKSVQFSYVAKTAPPDNDKVITVIKAALASMSRGLPEIQHIVSLSQ